MKIAEAICNVKLTAKDLSYQLAISKNLTIQENTYRANPDLFIDWPYTLSVLIIKIASCIVMFGRQAVRFWYFNSVPATLCFFSRLNYITTRMLANDLIIVRKKCIKARHV